MYDSSVTEISNVEISGHDSYGNSLNNSRNTGNTGTTKKIQKYFLIIVMIFVIVMLLVCIGVAETLWITQKGAESVEKRTVNTWQGDAGEEQERTLPQSELFQQFVSEVFRKDYTEVTKEEYASITSLRLGSRQIVYSIEDGEEVTLNFEEYLYEDMADLNCFPGLKKLDLSEEYYSLYKGDFQALTELEEISAIESPATLAELIPNKEKIRSIEIGDTFMVDSLEGIEEFTNLQALYIRAKEISNIKKISDLEHLEVLVIEDGSRINNFGILSSLKNLKTIAITASNLKNIDFMEELTQLENVTICESSIKDIESLREYKNTLKQLTLLENYDITDYSVIDEFTQLEEVSLGVSYDNVLPSFIGMTKLKKIYVEGAEDISFVGNAVNITELTLVYCNLEKIDVLTRLADLKVLHINDARTYTKSLSSLMQLTGLEVLDISDTWIFGYVEELLALPNLKEFYMDKCKVAFDFEKLAGNENLNVLSMKGVELIDYGPEYDENEYYSNDEGTRINISDYTEAFQKFPNLTELYLAGDEIDNVEFAKELSKLEILDISNNYVSSVAPLKELANLKILWCIEDDITDLADLGSEITVIEE